ncbi:AAA-ATPase-like protein [Salvia divinorum]|uniref:AAA-ATPase-like protein n=1 Tax=Salvia divinorum TaxID=28513 RepID=A0ABD1ILB9_SALDI
MAVTLSSMPPASSIFSMYASISASIMLLHTIINQLLPRPAQHFILSLLRRYFSPRPSHATVVIEERDGMSSNEIYSAAETYLCSHLRPDFHRLKVSKRHKDPSLSIRFAKCEKILDSHLGVPLQWRFINEERKKNNKIIDEDSDNVLVESEKRYFELSFDKEFRDTVLDSYIPSILERAKIIRAQKKAVKLHTLACPASYSSSFIWDSINLEHPSTFETLAMEPELKTRIKEDLDRFVRRKDFYRRVGRAWKRGYLLYGPPGTGKSSLIAAMANYLKFDIYDLELTNVKRDSDLRKLLLRTANRSILVIEDIDCTVELPDRKGAAAAEGGNGHFHRPRDHQFTLSGLLNFIDGLWSSCGDERIIIFTTNNKSKLDPALLRPGRMDMHIHMSYLTPDGFRLLAATYLNIHGHHPRLSEIEHLIKMKNITPAEVAEELMKCDDADLSLNEVLNFLKTKSNKEDDTKIISDKDMEDGAAKDQVTAHDCDF